MKPTLPLLTALLLAPLAVRAGIIEVRPVVAERDGSLLPGHNGSYCFGGSWFFCDSGNDLLAGVHGLPAGLEDPRMEHFSIERDREYVLPVIKTAQRLNPHLRFFASPWTPPPWMKTNGRYGGGSLRPECRPYFAACLVRFLEACRREGIEIHGSGQSQRPRCDGRLEVLNFLPNLDET